MKRNVTELEQKLINDGWHLTLKRYHGKNAEKTLCYEYHKTADLRHEEQTFNQFIRLDTKRTKITKFGIENLNLETLDDETMLFLRGLFISLRDRVARLQAPTKENEEKPNEELEKAKVLVKEGMTPIDVFGEEENETTDYLGSMTPEQMDELDQEMQMLDIVGDEQ